MEYNRFDAIHYAKKWAYKRNPAYYDFEKNGGDCTNFVSQCLFAGGLSMNYKKDIGWYYNSVKDRSAAWTDVEYLYKFLINNKGVGPKGEETDENSVQIGDIVQLSFDSNTFSHSLLITNARPRILLSAHTFDVYNKSLYLYNFSGIRFLHITN